MFTHEKKNDSEKSDQVDTSVEIGLVAWSVFARSMIGKIRLALLPSDEVRDRAMELFVLAFTARLTVYTPLSKPDLDKMIEDPLIDFVWEDYLKSCKGEIVLDGDPYPDTPGPVLAVAKSFFRVGFKAAGAVYNGILNNK